MNEIKKLALDMNDLSKDLRQDGPTLQEYNLSKIMDSLSIVLFNLYWFNSGEISFSDFTNSFDSFCKKYNLKYKREVKR